MLPLVAIIWGNGAKPTRPSRSFSRPVATALAWLLAERLGVRSLSTKIFLALFFVAGTDMWWCAQLGDVWFLAHLVAVAFIFGALLELTGRARGTVVGICFVLACGARFPEVAALPLFVWRPLAGAFAGGPAPRPSSGSRGCARSGSCARVRPNCVHGLTTS